MYPETYIIDRKGKMRAKIIGPQDMEFPGNAGVFRFAAGTELTQASAAD